MSILLRISKRRTSWEERDARLVLDAEFRKKEDRSPDLRVSVYEVDDEHPIVVRAHSEHYANAELNPRGMPNLDVSGATVAPLVQSQDSIRFQFIRTVHREIRFADERELLAFIQRVLDSVEQRRRNVTNKELKSYVAGRLAEEDPEWTAFVRESPKGKRYGRLELRGP